MFSYSDHREKSLLRELAPRWAKYHRFGEVLDCMADCVRKKATYRRYWNCCTVAFVASGVFYLCALGKYKYVWHPLCIGAIIAGGAIFLTILWLTHRINHVCDVYGWDYYQNALKALHRGFPEELKNAPDVDVLKSWIGSKLKKRGDQIAAKRKLGLVADADTELAALKRDHKAAKEFDGLVDLDFKTYLPELPTEQQKLVT